MPAESIMLGFIRKLEEQREEEAALFQGALGAQVSKEYLLREGSRGARWTCCHPKSVIKDGWGLCPLPSPVRVVEFSLEDASLLL